MRARTIAALAALLTISAPLVGCSEPQDSRPDELEYGSILQAPERAAYASGSETEPDGEGGRVDLTLDSGSEVVLWIDPAQITDVYVQHSDPDDADSWTEPERLYQAGAGCLYLYAATNGEVVGATFGCYEVDAFLQQAPDQGQAAATADLVDWKISDQGEFYGQPSVADDGEVTWEGSDFSWSP